MQATASQQCPWKGYVWAVVKLIVQQGCNLIWPHTDRSSNSELHLSLMDRHPPLGTQFLAAAVAAVAPLLQYWEATKINKHGASYLPASLAWAKGMAHWFQWVLWKQGCSSPVLFAGPVVISDARLTGEVVDGWERGPSLLPGLRHVSRALLRAQAMAMGRPQECRGELMTACLPATVSLAVLLTTKPQGVALDGWDEGRVYVPRELPADVEEQEESIPVEYVRLGSQPAFRVAAAHLKQALGKVEVHGRAIDLEAGGVEELGGSLALYAAVRLYQSICNRLRRMTAVRDNTIIIQTAATPRSSSRSSGHQRRTVATVTVLAAARDATAVPPLGSSHQCNDLTLIDL